MYILFKIHALNGQKKKKKENLLPRDSSLNNHWLVGLFILGYLSFLLQFQMYTAQIYWRLYNFILFLLMYTWWTKIENSLPRAACAHEAQSDWWLHHSPHHGEQWCRRKSWWAQCSAQTRAWQTCCTASAPLPGLCHVQRYPASSAGPVGYLSLCPRTLWGPSAATMASWNQGLLLWQVLC